MRTPVQDEDEDPAYRFRIRPSCWIWIRTPVLEIWIRVRRRIA